MLLAVLAGIAVLLTCCMFLGKSSMLGFPCAMFWALFGGQAYTLSTATWDIYFLTAIASLLGMTPFSAFAAFGLRTRKEEMATGDEFIDEGKDDMVFIDEEPVSKRRKGIRARVALRRTV